MSGNTPVAPRNHFSFTPENVAAPETQNTSRMGGAEPQQPQGPESPLQDRTASGRNLLSAPRPAHPAVRTRHLQSARAPHVSEASLRLHIHPQGTPSRGTSASHDRCSSYVRRKQIDKETGGAMPSHPGTVSPMDTVPLTHPRESSVCAVCAV